jgi:predicted transcriptional regulator
MPGKTIGLTRKQRDNIEEFLHLFADVELALKKRLGRRSNDPTGTKMLISGYVEKNPYWADSADRLRNLADIRNLLTHQRNTTVGYPIAIAPSSLQGLHEIRDHLLKPEPISDRYRKEVITVSDEDSLEYVLATAFEKGFSQFPVLSDERFGGLITENEIIRWLGHRAKANSVEVNLATVTVKMVLKEKDPFLEGIPIFHFEKLDAPAEEVMGRFSREPALEAVLLTRSGSKHTPIEGIITQWDAARYQG